MNNNNTQQADAVIYARANKEALAGTTSLDAQMLDCTQLADNNDLKVRRVFSEVGGGGLKSETLQALIKYCARHSDLRFVIVSDLSRFTRKFDEFKVLKAIFELLNVEVVSRETNDSPEVELLESMLDAIARYEKQYTKMTQDIITFS